jgi:hypothetical protein
MNNAGFYFQELQNNGFRYYNEELRLQRLQATKDVCSYDLDHIPFLLKENLFPGVRYFMEGVSRIPAVFLLQTKPTQ